MQHQVPGPHFLEPHSTEIPFMFFGGHTCPQTRVSYTRRWWVTDVAAFCFRPLPKHEHLPSLMKYHVHDVKRHLHYVATVVVPL